LIGLDTNVLVRYLVQDDEAQAAAASEVIESLSATERGFVSLLALAETTWVLTRSYHLDRPAVAEIIDRLLGLPELVVERHDLAVRAAAALRDGADFSDALIERAGDEAGCAHTVTFDRGASARAGMRLLSW
jgi:predicted nucleic-acid-binding protein